MELLSRHTDCLEAVLIKIYGVTIMARWKMFVDDGAANLKVNCNKGLDKIIVQNYCNLVELQPIKVLRVAGVIAQSL